MMAGNAFTSIPNGFAYYGLNKSVWDPVSIFLPMRNHLNE